MCLKIPKTIYLLNASLSHCWIWMSSFTNLFHHLFSLARTPPPLFFFLFLPAAVAMATRYLYLLTWQKLFHLSCLLCIHKSERSRGRGGWSANGLLYYLSPLQVTRQEGARKTDSGVIFIMQDGGTCREREREREGGEKAFKLHEPTFPY